MSTDTLARVAPMTPDKHAMQASLESDMITTGIHRFRKQVTEATASGNMTRTPGGVTLMQAAIAPFVAAVDAEVAATKAGKPGPGRKPAGLRMLTSIEPDVLGYIGVRLALDNAALGTPLQALSLAIANHVETELEMREFRRQAPGLYRIVHAQQTGKTKHSRHLINSMSAIAQHRAVDIKLGWSESEKLALGNKVIELLVQSTGIIEVITVGGGRSRHGVYKVQATADCMEWLTTKHGRMEAMAPAWLPCVVTPKDWTNPTDGGYHYDLAGKLTLIKTRNKAYLEELSGYDMPVVYRAINTLQRTAWQVNRSVLKVMQKAVEQQLPIAGLPTGDFRDLPVKPHDIAENDEARKEWKIRAAKVYDHNARLGGKVIALMKTMAVAEQFEAEEELYFPYQLDFRGRAYPVPMFLQPQGADPAKGLLRFAEGKPLGPDGAAWLAIHLANSYGYDKASLEERIQWTIDNTRDIAHSAMDPLGHLWWADGDSPWQVLAACYEWLGYTVEGESYVSHLPVAMDGSCNGLQHYSALLRDPVGGKATNLTPTDTPADIYSQVMRKTLERMGRETDEEKLPLARAWLESGQVDRKMCKRPVMTMPYGSRKYGIREQIIEELNARQFHFRDSPSTNKEASYLASVIWEAIGDTVVAARHGMDWLQKVAQVLASQGLPVHWTAPNGLPVLQAYNAMDTKRVKTQLFGSTYAPRMQQETDKLDRKRQANGIAPNFVHSLDASAMMLTVVAASREGVSAFAMVHDSYATHACDAPTLAGCLREEFVRMYTERDVLGEFAAEALEQLPEKLRDNIPDMPPVGTLDLAQVLESDFFFA